MNYRNDFIIKISSNISNKVIESTSKTNLYELEEFGISNLSQVFSNDIQTISNELVYPIPELVILFEQDPKLRSKCRFQY